MEAQRVEQAVAARGEPRIPARFRRARGAEARRPLAQLAAGERRQRAPRDVAVAAERPQARVVAGDHLGHLRAVGRRQLPRPAKPLGIDRLEHLGAEPPPKARRVVARLQDHGEPQVGGDAREVGLVGRGEGGGHGEAGGVGGGVLVALVHDPPHGRPGAPGAAQHRVHLGLARPDRRDGLVVGGEQHRAGLALPHPQQVVHERVGVGHRVRRVGRGGVARQQPQGAWVVVAGDDANAGPAEAAHDAERIGTRRLEHDGGRPAVEGRGPPHPPTAS